MGYFQVRYDSRVVICDHRTFIRLATGSVKIFNYQFDCLKVLSYVNFFIELDLLLVVALGIFRFECDWY